MLNYVIYIPSKGRHDICLTAELLLKYNMEFFLVVEPQDRDNYVEKYGIDNVIFIDENNRGINKFLN